MLAGLEADREQRAGRVVLKPIDALLAIASMPAVDVAVERPRGLFGETAWTP